MRSLFRIAVVALMLCMVPMQGFPWVAMAQCGTKTQETVAGSHAEHHHVHGLNVNDASHHNHDGHHHGLVKCGTCPGCCSGAMLMPFVDSTFPKLLDDSFSRVFISQFPPSIVPDNLDRPPKSLA